MVDGSYRADDALGRLMADFCESDPAKIRDAALRGRVQWLKESDEGVAHMCEIMEEALAQERRETTVEYARNAMSKVGCSAEGALDILGVPRDEWGTCLPELEALPVA
ncbi:MAG: hypothetical protein IKG18_16085 [Atopobiaceae bacterium]|nr:hypothetical protein [Atopobiaceae bacterium]